MKAISRLMKTISFQFEQLVGQIENHQAVAEASLQQLRNDIRKARVQYRLLEKDREQSEVEFEKNLKEVERWKERAKEYAQQDREKALHCVRRVKLLEEENEALQRRIFKMAEAAGQLKENLNRVETRYQDLQLKVKTFVSRDKAASLNSTGPFEAQENIEDVFSRWERVITEKEVESEFSTDPIIDELQREMDEECAQAELQVALDEILAKN